MSLIHSIKGRAIWHPTMTTTNTNTNASVRRVHSLGRAEWVPVNTIDCSNFVHMSHALFGLQTPPLLPWGSRDQRKIKAHTQWGPFLGRNCCCNRLACSMWHRELLLHSLHLLLWMIMQISLAAYRSRLFYASSTGNNRRVLRQCRTLSLSLSRCGWIVCDSLAWRAYWPKILASWQSTLSVLSHLLCKKRKSVNTSDNRGMPNAIAQNELNCSELAQNAV